MFGCFFGDQNRIWAIMPNVWIFAGQNRIGDEAECRDFLLIKIVFWRSCRMFGCFCDQNRILAIMPNVWIFW